MTINPLTAAVDLQAQEMYKNLCDDIIQAVGTDFYYLPKEQIEVDKLLREDVHRTFNNAYVIEGYVRNKDHYINTITTQAKYGTNFIEYMTLCITRRRFHEVLPTEIIRPKTGDLIYSPVYEGVFKVKYTEHEFPFHQLQQLTFYELYLERYIYGHDTINTNIDAINNIQYQNAYQIVIKYTNLNGTFAVGDHVQQVLDGTVLTGKIANIDAPNSQITLTDIKSTSELVINFISSDSYIIEDVTDPLKTFEITKVYNVDGTLLDGEDNLVIPNSSPAMNQELEKDNENYYNPINPNNPFWS